MKKLAIAITSLLLMTGCASTPTITNTNKSRVEKQEVNKRKVLAIDKSQLYKAMTRKQGALKIVKNHLFFKNFNS